MTLYHRMILLAPLLLAGATTGVHAQEAAFAGEGGLWVEEADGELRVGWITAEADSGFLQILQGERVRWEGRTAPGLVHQAALSAPGRGRFTLRYGSLGGSADQHRTVVDLGGAPRRPPVSVGRADSVFVLGDVHGEYERLVRLLGNAGVLDDQLRWRAGRSHLVLLGDLTDRGPDVNRLLWLVHRLEREAAEAGGRVHVLLGNHEIMVFTGDLRYVAPKEQQLAQLHGASYTRLYDPEHSVLGRWLASKPALLRIGRALFAHGGMGPDHPPYSLQAYDDSLAAFMGEELFRRWEDTTYVAPLDSAALARRYDLFWGDGSVFWHRGYVQADTLAPALARVLKRYRADVLVVGHTPRPAMEQRYGGALIAAHPARPADELLLLVRDGREIRRIRYGLHGPPAPLPPAPSTGPGG